MKKIFALTVSLWVVFHLSGCVLVPLALVGGGVVGGIAISEDTVQTEFDHSYDRVWDACVEVLEKAGAITAREKEAGRITAHVPKSKVTVQLEQPTESTVRVQVKARKIVGVVPDIKLAHTIAHRIGMAIKEAPVAASARAGK
jgi:hypothetical protein